MPGSSPLIGAQRQAAYAMLHDICRILDKANIHYILEAGTLLGVVREQQLLPWDTDLDLTVIEKDVTTVLRHRWKFWLAGYRTRLRRYDKDTGPFKKGMPRLLKVQTRRFLFFKKSNLMDIFFKYDMDGRYQWTIADRNPIIKKSPKHYYDNRKKIHFDGADFWCPEDSEGYLEYHYGKDWQTPIKEWDFRLDDSCEKEFIKDSV